MYNNILFDINNIYTSIHISNNKMKNDNYILYVEINFYKKYLYIIDYTLIKYIFEIPIIDLDNIKNIKTFILFDNYMIQIFEKYYGLFMLEYILSKPYNKIIYYQLFKKIILRFTDLLKSN
jgi:hypothetical protein